MSETQPRLVKIAKACGRRCSRELRLNAGGVPVLCGTPAWITIESTPLCYRHACERMEALEITTTFSGN